MLPSSRLAVAALASVTALAATARVADAQPTPLAPARQAIATNPLALPFGGISAEYERAVGRSGVALGLGGSASFANRANLSLSDGEFATVEGKIKYYPAENGLRGFAVGVTLGVIHGRDDFTYLDPLADGYCGPNAQCVTSTVTTARRATAATVGAVVDYNWLIGRRRRFLVGIGVGARRVLGSSTARAVLGDVLPDGRFVVGYAF